MEAPPGGRPRRGLEQGQGLAGVRPRQAHEGVARLVGDGERAREPPVVGEGALDEPRDRRAVERAQREQQGARQERWDDGERRVLRRGDQDHPSVLNGGQQGVLLRLGEAVDLVDEKDRLPAPGREPPPGPADHVADVLDARGHCRQLFEAAARRPGHQVGQGRLPRSGRPPQDHRRHRDGGAGRRFEQTPQWRALAEQMVLPDHLLDARGPHADGQRRVGAVCGDARVIDALGCEEIHADRLTPCVHRRGAAPALGGRPAERLGLSSRSCACPAASDRTSPGGPPGRRGSACTRPRPASSR